MEAKRMAGQYIACEVNRFPVSKFGNEEKKMMFFEQVGRRIRAEFPPCEGCKKLKVDEQPNYMRATTMYRVGCDEGMAEQGATLKCPDGFFGKFDMTDKKWKELVIAPMHDLGSPVKFAEEYLTTFVGGAGGAGGSFTGSTGAAGSADFPKLSLRDIELAKMEFERLSDSSGVSKISAGLAGFGPGSSTGLFSRDAVINPQIPTDRMEFPAAPRRNKDVPMTQDEGAW